MTPPPFDVVVFDLGGVLVRIAHSWAHAHALAGFPPHPIVDDPDFERVRVELGTAHQLGALTNVDYYRRKAEASRGAYTPADIERIIEVWSGAEYEGVGAVIDALDAAGIATAALSNTNPAHWARLDGTAEYPTVARLSHRHASHLLGLLKPAPAIYDAFSAITGFAPERTLLFDDAPANVDAARARGWTAELVDPQGETARQLLAHLVRLRVVGEPQSVSLTARRFRGARKVLRATSGDPRRPTRCADVSPLSDWCARQKL